MNASEDHHARDLNIDYVSYQAGNRLLIISGAGDAASLSTKLSAVFHISCLLQDEGDLTAINKLLASGAEIIPANADCEVKGYLGNFRLSGFGPAVFDQVLDFRKPPSIGSTIAPFGYYAMESGHEGLAEIVQKLTNMIGEFDKPRFFQQLPQLCAHNRRGIEGCRQCIDICATEAITPVDRMIQIDPHLCQGCGDCATACPAGAINFQFPDRVTTLTELKPFLAKSPAIVMFHGEAQEDIPSNFSKKLKIHRLESLGAAGIEVWLCALAYGARQIWLLDDSRLNPETRQVLNEQIAQADAILRGLGYPADLIQLATVRNFRVIDNNPLLKPASFAPIADKRTLVRMAVTHLSENTRSKAKFCPLPEPSAFGAIEVDTESCTLCMSCVSVCPEQALNSGNEMPQLKFNEAQCVQCGICRQACPEQAISLHPRFYYDEIEARKQRLLHEEPPFHCLQCGKPFASRSMIEAMIKKLEHHSMFQGEKKRLLMLCEECKVNAMFEKRQ